MCYGGCVIRAWLLPLLERQRSRQTLLEQPLERAEPDAGHMQMCSGGPAPQHEPKRAPDFHHSALPCPPQVLTTSLLQRALVYPKAYRGVDLRQARPAAASWAHGRNRLSPSHPLCMAWEAAVLGTD